MEQFKLQRNEPTPNRNTLVRLDPPYHRLIRRLKDETGISMTRILQQCIDYALQNSGERERELLALYTQPSAKDEAPVAPPICPFLGHPEDGDMA